MYITMLPMPMSMCFQVLSAAALATLAHTAWVGTAALPVIASVRSWGWKYLTQRFRITSYPRLLSLCLLCLIQVKGFAVSFECSSWIEAIFSYTSVAESSGTILCCKKCTEQSNTNFIDTRRGFRTSHFTVLIYTICHLSDLL